VGKQHSKKFFDEGNLRLGLSDRDLADKVSKEFDPVRTFVNSKPKPLSAAVRWNATKPSPSSSASPSGTPKSTSNSSTE
jgi:hypothetical protein